MTRRVPAHDLFKKTLATASSIMSHRGLKPSLSSKKPELLLPPGRTHDSPQEAPAPQPARDRHPHGPCEIFARIVNLVTRRVPEADQFQELLGLAAAEAGLTVNLAKGASPEVVARRRNVRISTVPRQICSVPHKTGQSRQVDLMWLLARRGRPWKKAAVETIFVKIADSRTFSLQHHRLMKLSRVLGMNRSPSSHAFCPGCRFPRMLDPVLVLVSP